MRHPPDIASETGILADLDVSERLGGDGRHVSDSLLDTTELPTIAHRPAHHSGQLWHNLFINGTKRLHTGDDGRDPVLERALSPGHAGRASAGDDGTGMLESHRRTSHHHTAVNWRNTENFRHTLTFQTRSGAFETACHFIVGDNTVELFDFPFRSACVMPHNSFAECLAKHL